MPTTTEGRQKLAGELGKFRIALMEAGSTREEAKEILVAYVRAYCSRGSF